MKQTFLVPVLYFFDLEWNWQKKKDPQIPTHTLQNQKPMNSANLSVFVSKFHLWSVSGLGLSSFSSVTHPGQEDTTHSDPSANDSPSSILSLPLPLPVRHMPCRHSGLKIVLTPWHLPWNWQSTHTPSGPERSVELLLGTRFTLHSLGGRQWKKRA